MKAVWITMNKLIQYLNSKHTVFSGEKYFRCWPQVSFDLQDMRKVIILHLWGLIASKNENHISSFTAIYNVSHQLMLTSNSLRLPQRATEIIFTLLGYIPYENFGYIFVSEYYDSRNLNHKIMTQEIWPTNFFTHIDMFTSTNTHSTLVQPLITADFFHLVSKASNFWSAMNIYKNLHILYIDSALHKL